VHFLSPYSLPGREWEKWMEKQKKAHTDQEAACVGFFKCIIIKPARLVFPQQYSANHARE